MSRLRHSKGVKAGALSGVHRLEVDKPHPFKPEEERKHGGHIGGKGEHSKLGRKRGGTVKKKRDDGGNVTVASKTAQGKPPSEGPFSDDLKRMRDILTQYSMGKKSRAAGPVDSQEGLPVKSRTWYGSPTDDKFDDRLESRARGGHVGHGHHGTDATPDRGMKYGTPVQDTPMTGRDSGYHGKGNIEDSLKDGGKVKWLQHAINPKHKGMEQAAAKKTGQSTHAYMEKHKHDSGKSGARARLGLRLSTMSKHKD
jgi:hypothetical protein